MINKEIPVSESASIKSSKNEEILKPFDEFEGRWSGDGSGLDDFADYTALEDQGW